MEEKQCTNCEIQKSDEKQKINKKLKIVGAIFIAIFVLSFLPIPFVAELNKAFVSYLSLIWWAVALGLILGGTIDYFVPEGFIFKYLGIKKKRSLIYAVLAGFLMSACSHGILAISMQLYKKGASISSVIAFLLAAPWANLPLAILMFGFFGLKALFIISGAMCIALITGFIFMFLEKNGLIEKSRDVSTKQNYTWKKPENLRKTVKGIWKGTVTLSNMVLWWILVGFLAAVFIRAYIPEHLFTQFLGPSIFGLVLTLAFATVIEVCSEGSAPIAFEIFNKVGTIGNPFVFLMAGVATDYTEIGLIWTNIGKKTAIWLPIITVPLVMLFGFLFNIFL